MIKIAPLSRLYNDIMPTLSAYYQDVYSTDNHVDGTYTKQCAEIISQHTKQHTVVTTSGTTAITSMLLAIGIQPNDEVLCVNYSNPASVMPIKLLGAVPVFVDINNYGCMDLSNLPITKNTKACIVTGLYGDSVDWDQIKDIEVPVLNDSAQCLTTKYRDNMATQYGDMTTLSFAFNKNAPVFGTYGSVSTDDATLYNKLKIINSNGYNNAEEVQISQIGINGKPSEDKSAQCLASMQRLASWQNTRNKINLYYKDVFDNKGVMVKPSPDYSTSNHHKFCIFTKNKRLFAKMMHDKGIECNLHYTYNFSKYPALNVDNRTYPNTNFYVDHAVCIPCHQWLSDDEINKVVNTVCEINATIGVPSDVDSLYS